MHRFTSVVLRMGAVAALFCALLAGPGISSAEASHFASVPANFSGHARVAGVTVKCSDRHWCAEAWQYSQTYGWRRVYLHYWTSVYVVPFGSGWSWTFTTVNGWLAIRTYDLAPDPSVGGIAFPSPSIY